MYRMQVHINVYIYLKKKMVSRQAVVDSTHSKGAM